LTRHDQDMIRLEAFPHYFGRRPWLDRIDIIKTPVELVGNTSHPLLLDAPDDSWREIRVKEEGANFIVFNCHRRGPLLDSRIRETIATMINPEDFCQEAYVNEVASSFLTSRKNNHAPSAPVMAFHGPVKIAAQQIREGVNHEREALILKSQLAKAGIEASVSIVHAKQFTEPEPFQTYDLFVGGLALGEDPLLSLIAVLQSKMLPLHSCLSEEMEDIVGSYILLLKETEDEEKRWSIYFKIEEYLLSEHALLFLTHRSHYAYEPMNSPYENIRLDSNGRVDYRKIWKRIDL